MLKKVNIDAFVACVSNTLEMLSSVIVKSQTQSFEGDLSSPSHYGDFFLR